MTCSAQFFKLCPCEYLYNRLDLLMEKMANNITRPSTCCFFWPKIAIFLGQHLPFLLPFRWAVNPEVYRFKIRASLPSKSYTVDLPGCPWSSVGHQHPEMTSEVFQVDHLSCFCQIPQNWCMGNLSSIPLFFKIYTCSQRIHWQINRFAHSATIQLAAVVSQLSHGFPTSQLR